MIAPYTGPDGPKLLALGDSITYQAQSLGQTATVLRDAGWAVSWNGWPGDEWRHHEPDLEAGAATAPQAVLLLFGTNDALRYPYSGDRHGGGEALCWRAIRWAEHYRAACPGAAIVLMTLNEWTLDSGSNWLTPIYNEYMRIRVPRIEGAPVGLLDWAGIVDEAKAVNGDVLDQYALHPNAAGRDLWEAELLSVLTALTAP